MPDPLDLLGLRRPASGLRFGTVDAGFAAGGGSVTSALNARTTATVNLRHRLLAGLPVDYLAPIAFGSASRTLFNGIVIEAIPDGPLVRLTADAAPELGERQILHLESRVPHFELVHLMARSAGIPEQRLDIEGMDALPLEAIEVIAPVHGVTLEEPLRFGSVRIVPQDSARSVVDSFGGGEAKERFRGADAFAIGLRVRRRLLDAETAVLPEIDDALAWLTVRARYGLALMPNGRPQHYRRRFARARPRRGDLVVVRGMISGRAWFRAPLDRVEPVEIELDRQDRTWSLPPEDARSLQNRQAVLACARAAHTEDPVQRVQALWEAIEFYVGGVDLPKRFAPAEAKRIKKAIPKDVDPELRERAIQLLAKLNDPPLMAKLIETARQDGVPLAEGERTLLADLRGVRNGAVHGKAPELPDRETIDHGVSIVARLLVYRLQSGD